MRFGITAKMALMAWALVMTMLVITASWFYWSARQKLAEEGMERLQRGTREIGNQLQGAIGQQRSDTYWQAQPDRGNGHLFYARDLFEAAPASAQQEEAVKKLTENINRSFADRSSYLWIKFLTRDAAGSRVVLRLERSAEGRWKPVGEAAVHPHSSSEEDYLGFTLHPTPSQLLLTRIDSLERKDGAKVPGLLTAAFVRKPNSQPPADVLGLVVIGADLSVDPGPSDKASSDAYIDILTDETGKLWGGPPAVMDSAGEPRWDAVVDKLQKTDDAEPLPLRDWEEKPLMTTWSMGYFYPSVRLKPFENKTFALHFVRIQYDKSDTDNKRFLGLARFASDEKLLGPIDSVFRQVLYLVVLLGFIAAVLAALCSLLLTRPLKRIIRAAKKFGGGELTRRCRPTTRARSATWPAPSGK